MKPCPYQFFMDDLKLYVRSRKALRRALEIVDRVSSAVGMELGLRNCAVATVVHWVLQEEGDAPFLFMQCLYLASVI
jgi:hypothetical protein